jgi:hypothetical protein
MSNKLIQRILTLCALACIALVFSLAQDYKPLLGKWTMTSETDQDAVKWILVLKEADGHLTASVAVEDQEQPTKSFTYADGVLKFKVPYQDEDYDIELKASPDKLVGTWSGGGNSGKTTGVKM